MNPSTTLGKQYNVHITYYSCYSINKIFKKPINFVIIHRKDKTKKYLKINPRKYKSQGLSVVGVQHTEKTKSTYDIEIAL